MKFCFSCHKSLEDNMFRKTHKGKLSEWCKDCMKNLSVQERNKNKVKFVFDTIKTDSIMNKLDELND